MSSSAEVATKTTTTTTTTPRSTGGSSSSLSVHYVNRCYSHHPTRSETAAPTTTTGSTTTATPPYANNGVVVGFRSDLNLNDQQIRLAQYRDVTTSGQIYRASRAAAFDSNTSLTDMKWRIKALIAESFFYQNRVRHSTSRRSPSKFSRTTPRWWSRQKPADDPTSQSSPLPPPGTASFTEMLIGDVDVTFQHCMITMPSNGEVSSVAEGAALAFRHCCKQVAELRLWADPAGRAMAMTNSSNMRRQQEMKKKNHALELL